MTTKFWRPVTVFALLSAMLGACAHSENYDRSRVRTHRVDRKIQVDKVPVRGFDVRIEQRSATTVVGELLAVGTSELWVQHGGHVVKIPASSITQVIVLLRKPSGAAAIAAWTAGGAITTLSHGLFLAFSAPTWILIGTSMAISASQSAKLKVKKPENLVHLYQFARFPQGWPCQPG